MLQNYCQFLKFDQIFEMKTWKETKACNISWNSQENETRRLAKNTSQVGKLFLHKSIKIGEVYNSRTQFKSNPFHLPWSALAVTLHYCHMISALIQQQQTKPGCTSCMFKSNPFIQKRNKIPLNSRK